MFDQNAPIIPDGSFKWKEYTLLSQWNQYAVPTELQRKNAIFLFSQLQPLRKILEKPLVVTSGCRTGAYTQYLRSVGIPAALQSAHLDWRAVDLSCPGMPNEELYRFLDKHWVGRMELLKYTPGWVHIDTRDWGKRLRFKP